MKITTITQGQYIANTNNKTNTINFSGLKQSTRPCMFVFDLDGSLAKGIHKDIQKIFEIAKQRMAHTIYATGRNKKEVEKLQLQLAEKGIILPNPEYLICNNGQFLYENIDGTLVKNEKYEALLKEKTNFNSKEVFKIMKNLAKSEEYKFSPDEVTKIQKLTYGDIPGHDITLRNERPQDVNCYNDIKLKDPDFHDSKISYYEWNASDFMSEYFVASGVDLHNLKQNIKNELAKSNIKTKFIDNLYSKKIMDTRCREHILLQAHPFRRHNDGSMTALFLCPADKSDGIKYLKNQFDIPFNEIIMAGNEDNDIPMANLVKEGANFICLNPSEKLKEFSETLRLYFKNILMPKEDGAKGILEGLNQFIKF